MKSFIIGRDPKVDITLNDSINSVSRKHAELVVLPDGTVTLEDLESTNGIKINGRRIKTRQPFYLQPGDEVMLAGRVALDWEQYAHQYGFLAGSSNSFRETADMGSRGKSASPVPPPPPPPEPVGEVAKDEWEPGQEFTPHQKGNRPTFRRSTPSEGISGTVVGDFFDRVIPIPALSRSLQLFFSLHVKPLFKITSLVRDGERVVGVPYVHPFNFLGVAVVFFFLSTIIFKKAISDIEGDDSVSDLGPLEWVLEDPILAAVYFSIAAFLYTWIGYGIFKRTTKTKRSFRKYLMLNSLTTGMMYFYFSAFFVFLGVSASMANAENEAAIGFFLITLLAVMVMVTYFVIVNLRAARRFWKLPWFKFLMVYFLVSILSSIPLSIFQILSSLM